MAIRTILAILFWQTFYFVRIFAERGLGVVAGVELSVAETHFFASLTQKDYDTTKWLDYNKGDSNEDVFVYFATRMSESMRRYNQTLNLVTVGAGAGNHNGIIQSYLNNGHWKGMFIDAIQNNTFALQAKMFPTDSHKRSLLVTAVATDICVHKRVQVCSLSAYGGSNEHRQIPIVLDGRTHVTPTIIVRSWEAASPCQEIACLSGKELNWYMNYVRSNQK